MRTSFFVDYKRKPRDTRTVPLGLCMSRGQMLEWDALMPAVYRPTDIKAPEKLGCRRSSCTFPRPTKEVGGLPWGGDGVSPQNNQFISPSDEQVESEANMTRTVKDYIALYHSHIK